MAHAVHSLDDLEARAAQGGTFARADAERLLACPDLISIGVVGEAARRRRSGNEVTFGRVCTWTAGSPPGGVGAAGEVRITGAPSSIDDARSSVRHAAALARAVPLTGFSAADLLQLVGHDHLALAELARMLHADGLEAVAEVPVDIGEAEHLIEVVRAFTHGGLGAWRLTVGVAGLSDRLELVERAAVVARETRAVKAFAPLPRLDPTAEPSTGYDDLRTVTIARLLCDEIPALQIDWALHGPKLAQVAILYGANDLDGIAAEDDLTLGPRRAPREEILRQIRAAGVVPAERNGRYERLA